MRTSLTAAILLSLAAASLGEELPDGLGVTAPSSSVFTADITTGDTDYYVFQGYPGMSVTATVKALKGSTLQPDLQIVRPGGTVVGDDEGIVLKLTSKSATATLPLDATGWWQVRVRGVGTTTGAYSASVKYATPKLPVLPLISKGFKSAGAVSPAGDVDEFAFQAYTGQSLSATLVVGKTSALDPQLQLIRPNGTAADDVGGADALKKLSVIRTLDADGTWRLRVAGNEVTPGVPADGLSTGAYALTVKLGKPAAIGLAPDSNGQYRLSFPAIGGASLGYSLSFSGSAPTYNSFRDPTGKQVTGFPGGVSVKSFLLPARLPIGEYVLVFDAPAGARPTNVQFTRTLVLPKGAAKRVAKLASLEPTIRTNGINPTEGGPGTLLSVQVNNIADADSPNGDPALFLDHYALTGVQLQADGVTLRGTVPDDLPEGVFDVVAVSTSGQVAVKADAFRRVPPPVVTGIDPTVGTEGGGFSVTITGSNFRPGRMGILLDGVPQPVTPDPTLSTDTSVTFNAPQHTPGFVVFGVKDNDTQLVANLPLNSFEYVATPAISRIVPSLIPILGNETIAVQGANFSPLDKVYLETTPNSGVYQLLTTPSTPTFINSRQHQFLAPVRPKGVYRVYVQDTQGQPNPPKTRNLTYYSFADATAGSNLGTLGSDKWDGWTTAISDYDKDGDQDLFVSRRGAPADTVASANSLTRVLRNDGNSQFADVTASVLPATGVDDWRSDRIWVTDVDADTFPDIAITTNTKGVPTPGTSHTRLLINEPRGGAGAGATDRVFRDHTLELIAPPRVMSIYFGGEYVSDDWRGLDMWVGDVDKGPAGPPEILITHDEVKDDNSSNGIHCGNYCPTTAGSYSLAYIFYWGGSRLMVWDKNANKGQGRYKFDHNFFPRRSGPLVPTPTPSGTIPSCASRYGTACKDTFTPFTGKRLAVGTIDGDTKPDIAVISDKVISRRAKVNDPLLVTSSVQVALNKFNGKEGSGVTDITGVVFALGGNTQGDAIAIGHPGFPDGGSEGVIAFAPAATTSGGAVLRLLKYRPGTSDFEEISSAALPVPDQGDAFQASRISFTDIDQDGDEDLVFVAAAPPGGTQVALRVLRNERDGTNVGVMKKTLLPLLSGIVTATEHLEGDWMSIGDVTGDGFPDYVVTRATPSGAGSQTRIVRTDK